MDFSKNYLTLPLLLLALASCNQNQKPAEAPPSQEESEPSPAAEAPMERATRLLGRVPAGSFGPRLAEGKEGRLAVWAEAHNQDPIWESLFIPEQGSPQAAIHFDKLLPGLETFEVAGLSDGHFLVVSRRHSSGRDVLETQVLDARGQRVQGAHPVAEANEILYNHILPTQDGALILYATASAGGASLSAYHFSTSGQFRAPQALKEGVYAWQVAQKGDKIYLATVSKGFTNRKVEIHLLDPAASVAPRSLQVAQIPGGALDLDLKVGGGRVYYAFSEVEQYESKIRWGAVDLDLAPQVEMRALTLPRGQQSLISLAATEDEVMILWEEPSLARQSEREILGALLRADEVVTPQISFSTGAGDSLLPQVAFDGHNFQIIAEYAPSLLSAEFTQTEGTRGLFVAELDPKTGATKTRLPQIAQLDGQWADMAWDLSCKSSCELLLAQNGNPNLVFVADLAKLPEAGPQILNQADWPQPQMAAVETLGPIKDLSSLTVQEDERGRFLAWVTYFDPELPYEKTGKRAPDGRDAPERAHLQTLFLPPEKPGEVVLPGAQKPNAASKEPTEPSAKEHATTGAVVHSYRARSLGGVSMSSPNARGERVIAWAAMDGKEPQLFATLVDASGKKLKQKMLTRSPGEITDVALLRREQGNLLLWIDHRDEAPTIYSQIVDDSLNVVRREKSLTLHAENPTGLTMREVGDEILVVYSDSEGAENPGYGDLFALSLSAKTGELTTRQHRLFATAPHSHSAALSASLSGRAEHASLAWIESSLDDAGQETCMLRRAEIDVSGRALGSPDDFAFAAPISSFSLHCEAGRYCDLVFPLLTGEQARLWAISVDHEGVSEAHPLYSLTRPVTQMVSPRLLGRDFYYVDQLGNDENLLMQLQLTPH